MKYLSIFSLALASLVAGYAVEADAQCATQPSCSSLGYSYTGSSTDCVNTPMKCPFDTSYFNCVKKNDALSKLKSDIITATMPDYSKSQTRSSGSTYTASTNGYIMGYAQGTCDAGNHSCENQQNFQIIIDGRNVRQVNKQINWSHDTWSYPVKKGSTYKVYSAGNVRVSYVWVPAG